MEKNVRLCYFCNNETLYIGYIEGKKVETLNYWDGGIDSELIDKKEVSVLVTEYTNGEITRHIIDKETSNILKVELDRYWEEKY